MIRIEPVSETSLIVYLGEQIDTQLTQRIGLLAKYLKDTFPKALIEVIPSYTSLFVQYHPRLVTYSALYKAITHYAPQLTQVLSDAPSGKLITLPVYYDHEVGPDLVSLAELHGITSEQVIAYHIERTYTVCAIGFAPGFAFLASVDDQIATPRHAEPRQKIPAGSVGIANEQTAVYPADSPGGWQIIGNCPTPLYSPLQDPMSPFEVGDRVRFESIGREQFLQQGGSIWPHWK
ncbi:allophanate hydrolase [Photobacterium proteolyticum]|uniref:Allophanate hydrolase n=1 Tax=Photobacterium proteolyticum TaxID=1903952 RepID=A0A1Q9GSF2_9GAMM|nr:5-oxoprolinase subunit PxpB [Photobacterium proteolyticum]OLQ77634.1 allophanate hydrolase [Photobacterium proteolyticum]